MPLPTIAFGILLSTFYGTIYHVLRGGSSKRIVLFLILSWIGFWLGDTISWYTGWSFAPAGLLNAGAGTVFALVFMIIGDVVSSIINSAKQK